MGCTLKIVYGRDTMPRELLGLNANDCSEYMHVITNRRCAQLGQSALLPDTPNPFTWMSETMDLKKEKILREPRDGVPDGFDAQMVRAITMAANER